LLKEGRELFDFNHKYNKYPHKIYLSSPTMHGPELNFIKEAYESNWVSTVGENISECERLIADVVGRKYGVGLSSGTSALHMCVKLAGERFYGPPKVGHGTLEGHRVFCSDMTFGATVNPVAYEGGEALFIDTEYDTWNMDPVALEKAFDMYPDVRIIIIAHLYGTPAKLDEIRAIADKHGAVIIEDAAESLGATYKGKQTGSFGDYSIISFNGNKIITGSCGGMFLTNDKAEADKVRKWSTQSREAAPWYQHEEIGYNYRMSNVIAGVIRGQIPFLEKHISQKKEIYNRYKTGLADFPFIHLNPFDTENSEPNYWLSCMIIDSDHMCQTINGERDSLYIPVHGKSCPSEVLEAIASINAEGRPIWKPMHMQPMYRLHEFITKDGSGRARTNAYIKGGVKDVGADIFERGLCLPSDNKMTADQQKNVVDIIHRCFI
jgi:dTDP-4-amino-4,6-dideoxygalactose transaminase